MPSDTQLDIMQKIFDNFCVGTLNIGFDRRYSSPSKGGLGLVRIRDFLISQHTIWLKRAKNQAETIGELIFTMREWAIRLRYTLIA